METTTNPALNNFKLQNRSLTVNDLKAQREAELREQSKAKLEDQRKKFNEIAEEKAKEEKMRIIFDKLDINKDNSISPEEFEKMLQSWGLEFSKANIEHIIKSFSTTSKISLNFSEFKTITEFLIKVKSTFLRYDANNDGNIDKNNVSKALEEFAFKLPLDSLKKLTALFDTDKSGETEFQEFIALMLYIHDLQKLFLGADKDRSNILDAAELHALLRTMGIALTPLEIEIFMAKIAPETKKGIDFAGFADLMLKLRDQRGQIEEEAKKQREEGKRQLTAKPLKEAAGSMMSASSPRGTVASPRAGGAGDGHKVLEKRIIDECTKNKKLWEDPDFPAAPGSLYRKLAAKSGEVKSWKRPSELSTKAKLFQNGCDEGDIKQGSLGDCWFLSAISVVAQLGNTEIEHLFVSQHPECGFYQVGFFKDREFTVITVDDRIPCGMSGRPIYAHCADPDEFWVPIVEKAFAKMHGCYENIIAGIPSDALVDLTGESAESHEIENTDKFWRELLQFTKEKYLMGSACNNRRKRIDLGIIDEHAYGVFEAREVEGHKLVRIRNPWGGTEWKGRWCDGSKEWNDFPRVKAVLNHQFVDDGTFWMCFEDFCQEYTILYVLRMLTDNFGDKYEKYSLTSEWKGVTAGGCINNNTWYKNPQWLISTNEKDCDVSVSLSLPDSRVSGEAKFPAVGIMIMGHKKGASTKKMQCKPEEVIVMPHFKPARETTASFVMAPGETYAIIPSTFNKGTESKFFLNIFSKKRIVVKEPASEELTGHTIKGKFVKGQSAGGCANHPTWGMNPQYVLIVKTAGEVTVGLEQLTENPTHIGYTVLKGDGSQRRKPEMKDSVGNSGSFVNSAQVSADFKLPAGDYIVVPSTFKPHEELDFVMRVEGDGVAELKPVLEWETVKFTGKYATKSGGCQNNRDTWMNNPVFKFEVPKKTRLGITVAFNDDVHGHHHGFYVFGKEVVRDSIGRSSFVPTTSAVTQHIELEPGTYNLLVCSFNPGLTGNFTVTMFADVKVKI